MKGTLPRNQILLGDVRTRLSELPSSSVDTVITSPPYFALRNYGHPQQIGAEADVNAWVEQLRLVCRQLAQVLKPTGSLWLNVGDSYSDNSRQGALPKSLLLGPQRLSIALAQDGWVVRNQVIWDKTNSMPASVTDRMSCKYEVLLLLVRSRSYFFDLDAVRLPATSSKLPGNSARTTYLPPHTIPQHSGIDLNFGLHKLKRIGRVSHPLGKNPGDVWQYPTAGFRGAHFAAFPLSLVERPLLTTCPKQVCNRCGAPWTRSPVDRTSDMPCLGLLEPSCGCNSGTTPGVVLDPFMGSGTIALAARNHGRDWLGIELNAEYASMAHARLARG